MGFLDVSSFVGGAEKWGSGRVRSGRGVVVAVGCTAVAGRL
jgi:hypothetical protein